MRLVLDARTASFAALIDYAGLFPPALLSLEAAVAEYRKARSSRESWVAGRFLCHATRLEALGAILTGTLSTTEDAWDIGVIFDTTPGEAASYAQSFHTEMQPAAVVSAAEAKIVEPSIASINALLDAITSIQPDIAPFLEVMPTAPMDEQVALISEALADRHRMGAAKLRCGGTTAALFPDAETVASFIVASTDRSLSFKATAGLHQPIRHLDADLGVWRHGFVNILIASAAAAEGHPQTTVTAIIEETDPVAFSIGTAFATWRDISIPGPAMQRIRSRGFVGYGSCDFFEPIEALRDLSFLGEGT